MSNLKADLKILRLRLTWNETAGLLDFDGGHLVLGNFYNV